jgi:tRNA threonylcarbamoyladenosine biosynthesis protein TsaE
MVRNNMNKGTEFIIEDENRWNNIIPQIHTIIGWRNIILLYGDLGTGKTTFVKYFLRYFSCNANVDSPSFAIVNEYECPELEDVFGNPNVYHLDLYRINDPEELVEAGIEEMFYKPGLLFIEWPEIAESMLPEEYARIDLSYFNTGRKLVVL